MPPRSSRLRVALLAGAGLLALTSASLAKDLPATEAGVAKIKNFITTYGGKNAVSSPGFSVKADGSDYLVSVDLGAITAALKDAGISYDSATIVFKVFEQDDGAWRLEQNGLPPIGAHIKQSEKDGGGTLDIAAQVDGHKNSIVIDPATSWIRAGQASDDKANVEIKGPGLSETIGMGAIQAAITTKPAADGAVSTTMKETLSSFSLDVKADPKEMKAKVSDNAKPVHFTAQATATGFVISLDGFKPRPALDIWAFSAAHPTRQDLAANAPAFKGLLSAALAAEQASISQNTTMDKLTVQTSVGAFTMDKASFDVGFGLLGPASHFEEHIAASNIVFPPGVVPPAYAALTPTSVDIGFKVSGFDTSAAGAEWISDLRLDGDGPPISKEDGDKVFAKLVGGKPVVVEVPVSHIVAPKLDITIEGKVTYDKGQPTGSLKLRVKDFDKSVEAAKALGPEAEKQIVPMVAMAKGLAKSEADGVLTWVAEVGLDKVVKINGLPLGKLPF